MAGVVKRSLVLDPAWKISVRHRSSNVTVAKDIATITRRRPVSGWLR